MSNKILPFAYRTIQIYLMQGKQKSKFYEEQRTQVNGCDAPVVALRFKEVHMMWLTCDAVSLIILVKLSEYLP